MFLNTCKDTEITKASGLKLPQIRFDPSKGQHAKELISWEFIQKSAESATESDIEEVGKLENVCECPEDILSEKHRAKLPKVG